MSKLFVNTDGGARGNPGPAAIGIVFFNEKGDSLYSYNEAIGTTTNNEAEYRAILKAVEVLSKSKWLKENPQGKIICRIDSLLVVEQLNGNYKVKQAHLQDFISRIRNITSQFSANISFTHIPREENKVADKLVNQALNALR